MKWEIKESKLIGELDQLNYQGKYRSKLKLKY